jgi:hypothetical protein
MNTRRTSPPKKPKKNKSRATNMMLHTDIIGEAQGARVSGTHAREAMNNHQNSQVINQLNRHRRQPTPILHGEGIVVMDRLNRMRAKQSRSAEVRIKFAMLSSQCKAARDLETSTCTRNIGVRASTCNRHINNNGGPWDDRVTQSSETAVGQLPSTGCLCVTWHGGVCAIRTPW